MWKELWTEYFCSQWNITTEQKSDCMWSRNPGPETIRPFAYITTKSKTIVVKLFCYVSFFLHLVSVVVHFSKNAFCWMSCLECLDLKRIMFRIHWACVCIMKAALLTAYAFDHLCVPGALLLFVVVILRLILVALLSFALQWHKNAVLCLFCLTLTRFTIKIAIWQCALCLVSTKSTNARQKNVWNGNCLRAMEAKWKIEIQSKHISYTDRELVVSEPIKVYFECKIIVITFVSYS